MTLRTVTLSPGFDHHVTVDEVIPGGVGSVLSWTVAAAGKGLNVARVASCLGVTTTAYSLVGADDAPEFARLVEADGVRPVLVDVDGETRRNLTLSVASTGAPASHMTGARLATAVDDDADALVDRLLADVEAGDVVSFNGAAPPPIRSQIWAQAARSLAGRGVRIVADVQGDALRAVVETGLIRMAKPNEDEAAALVPDSSEHPVRAQGIAAVRAMSAAGVEDPVVSLGADGVLHLVDGELCRSWSAVSRAAVAVGAGDAFVAGYCAALASPRWTGTDPVSLGLAAAAAHVSGESGERFEGAVRAMVANVRHEQLA
ncbi:PfkB family carbohydrate kinase [Angustibacter sp. Root456]|uniref:PfkB family carbohydrate kinase n=1 Tax=Angustibacter sp. Root456 TaxID=1736539 RepID=UPI0006FD225D|nr:PfkB family carbohydrate kinase [Angustibacter sp. Root456]KQX66296.1 hypothetical protein ASD06_08085 [Angustibacter sp. Root456]